MQTTRPTLFAVGHIRKRNRRIVVLAPPPPPFPGPWELRAVYAA